MNANFMKTQLNVTFNVFTYYNFDLSSYQQILSLLFISKQYKRKIWEKII